MGSSLNPPAQGGSGLFAAGAGAEKHSEVRALVNLALLWFPQS